MTDKLTRSQREQIIFNHIKGIDDPLYEVSQTKYGKWLVKPKKIQLEEEETVNESEPEEERDESLNNEPQPVKPTYDKQQAKRERRRRNRHAKQDAKRILDALTNLINSNNNESSDDEQMEEYRAPPLVEPNNFNPTNLSYRRRRLAF